MIARLTFRISMLSLFVASVVACSDNPDKELDDLKVEVAKLRQDLATAYTRITSLEGEVDALTGGTGLAELQSDVDTLQTTVGSHTTRLDSLDSAVSATSDHTSRLAALETKTASMTAENVDSKAAVVFTGVNVHIRSGSGYTEDDCYQDPPCTPEKLRGLGNLIVGYNEPPLTTPTRTGSHNLVVGRCHRYSSYGGLVTGYNNTLSADEAAIVGGAGNTASGSSSAILGSGSCTASTDYATVYGGENGGSPDCQMVEP